MHIFAFAMLVAVIKSEKMISIISFSNDNNGIANLFQAQKHGHNYPYSNEFI